jgi:hypothetical protein
MEAAEALNKYREMKKFKREKHGMVSEDRMIMLGNDECGTVPLKEGQPIKIMVMGVIGKPKKEGYPIRIDSAKMHEEESDESETEPVVSPSA